MLRSVLKLTGSSVRMLQNPVSGKEMWCVLCSLRFRVRIRKAWLRLIISLQECLNSQTWHLFYECNPVMQVHALSVQVLSIHKAVPPGIGNCSGWSLCQLASPLYIACFPHWPRSANLAECGQRKETGNKMWEVVWFGHYLTERLISFSVCWYLQPDDAALVVGMADGLVSIQHKKPEVKHTAAQVKKQQKKASYKYTLMDHVASKVI